MTALLLFIGTAPIAYIREHTVFCLYPFFLVKIDPLNNTAVVVVGALIFVLGIDLVKEALWDTRHRTSR
jgi:SulP family sulfate permease